MTAPTTATLLALSNDLQRMADELKAEITGGTKEQWDAWQCLQDASRAAFSAAAWLHRHQERSK